MRKNSEKNLLTKIWIPRHWEGSYERQSQDFLLKRPPSGSRLINLTQKIIAKSPDLMVSTLPASRMLNLACITHSILVNPHFCNDDDDDDSSDDEGDGRVILISTASGALGVVPFSDIVVCSSSSTIRR